MIREGIQAVVEGRNLTEAEAIAVMREIMEGSASPAQIAAFIVGLRMKGETVEEITGCARVMRDKATFISTPPGAIPVDTAGTGGDGAHTFNISTTAAFVAAGAGVVMAKHGNRAASSVCGSADLLEALGGLPDDAMLMSLAIVTLGTLYVSLRLPGWLMPLSYFLRVVCFIQSTAILFFAVTPQYFPHTLSTYLSMMLDSTIGFISAIPAIMGFTFYIFDFRLRRKVLLTVLIMAHLVILTPLQYLIHAYVMAKGSLLFMPLLYTMFGLLPQVALFIAFYSWGLSWPGRDEEMHQ